MPIKKCLYIVEDDPDTLEMLLLVFKDDYEVIGFHIPDQSFLESIDKKIPDLVLMDFILPTTNTSDIIETIRAKFKEKVKILLVSGIQEKYIPKGILIDHFIAKPYKLAELKDTLRRLSE